MENETEEMLAHRKAGKIVGGALALAAKKAKPGYSLLALANEIEKYIHDEGGQPAFPVNLSANNAAAHDTPAIGDERTIGEQDVLKVDVGAHVDGYIADAAHTLDFSQEHGKMVEAARKALENALSVVKEGVSINEIGSEIERTIKDAGFTPVYNLTGHGLAPYVAHAPPTIPNHATGDTKELEDGMVFAIEPFATNGRGHVAEGAQTEIFSLSEKIPTRNPTARKITEHALSTYHGLPFAERWLQDALKPTDFARKTALRELMGRGLHAYPVLREKEGNTVAQAETSVMLINGEPHILVDLP